MRQWSSGPNLCFARHQNNTPTTHAHNTTGQKRRIDGGPVANSRFTSRLEDSLQPQSPVQRQDDVRRRLNSYTEGLDWTEDNVGAFWTGAGRQWAVPHGLRGPQGPRVPAADRLRTYHTHPNLQSPSNQRRPTRRPSPSPCQMKAMSPR